jgi:large subunit ribosomal protein L31
MKTKIHPTVNRVKIICSCGASYDVSAAVKEKEMRVEICSKCHPHYTGEQKILKTGSVDKFYARMKKTEEKKAEPKTEAKKTAKKK